MLMFYFSSAEIKQVWNFILLIPPCERAAAKRARRKTALP